MLSSIGDVEDDVAALKRRSLNKKCFALPSTVVHTRAQVYSYRRKNFSRTGKIFFQPGDCSARVELRFQYFNLFFVRFWLEWSLGFDTSHFVVKGNGPHEWDSYGESVFASELYSLYKSRCIAQLPNRRPLWIYSSCPVSKMLSGKPQKPGYWKVKINPDHIQDYLLTMRRWNCSYTLKEDTLYFSNTLAAAAGLPPNAEHLGLSKIEMYVNPRSFGGLAIKPGYGVSDERMWYKMDLVCHVVNNYKLEYSLLRPVANALGVVVDALEMTQIVKLSCFVAVTAGECEFNIFVLKVDTYVRGLVERSVV